MTPNPTMKESARSRLYKHTRTSHRRAAPARNGKRRHATRRDQILAWMAGQAKKNPGNLPSSLEIAEKFKISQQTVYRHMLILKAEGRLLQQGGKWTIPLSVQLFPPEVERLIKLFGYD